jgi:DNA excision repair protein ERCC-3
MSGEQGGDVGLAAQWDAVEEAASLLSTRQSAEFDDELGFDFSGLEMQPHHESKPLWVTPTGRIFLEAFSPHYDQARDFLVAICEPKSRPEFIHEYALDRHALFAAASMGLTGDIICAALDKFSKCKVSSGVKQFVMACTSGYGKVKLVLHRSRYYIESSYPSLLKELANDPVIKPCRVMPSAAALQLAGVDEHGFLIGDVLQEAETSLGLGDTGGARESTLGLSKRRTGEVGDDEEVDGYETDEEGEREMRRQEQRRRVPGLEEMSSLDDEALLVLVAEEERRTLGEIAPESAERAEKRPREEDGEEGRGKRSQQESDKVLRFEIQHDKIDVVRAACSRRHPPIPLMLEYDFREDRVGIPSLAIELARPEGLRPYQSRSLAKMFGNGRARSGMIVLPCGAGKTLVGIAAVATVKKSAIVLCPNETSINQWIDAFVHFAKFGCSPETVVRKLTRSSKDPLPPRSEPVILLTTYSMIGMRNNPKAAAETVARLREIEAREWGVMLLDETHQVVADTFRRVLFLSAHCRLGLTATVSKCGSDRVVRRVMDWVAVGARGRQGQRPRGAHRAEAVRGELDGSHQGRVLGQRPGGGGVVSNDRAVP